MPKLRVSKISIRNILGVEEVEFEPGRLTVIKGPNNKGKTSVLEAIRSVFQGGNDATLLRHGADEGQVVIVLDDGSEITEKVNAAGKRSVSVKNPNFGKSSRPQSVLDNLVNRLTLNPVEFLVSNSQRQREMLLQALPMTVTAEQIFEATGLRIDVNPKLHALEIIENNRLAIYEQRTGANRALKEKQATARQLQETLPDDAPEGEWSTQYGNVSLALDNFDKETNTETVRLEKELLGQLEGINEQFLASVKTLERVAMEKIEAIRADLKSDHASLKESYESTREELIDESELQIQRWAEERTPERERMIEQRQHARTMADMAIKSESAKRLLVEMNDGAVSLKLESDKMTKALEGLESLKEELTSTLPIRGLEIRDGELYLDGIKFSRWNEARRVTTSIELAKLSSGNLGLVIVDGLERLNGETFEAFAAHLNTDDTCQYVVTRVTDDAEMSIETR